MLRTAHFCLRALLLWVLCLSCATAHARIGLVVGEPFGSFGTMLPVGHASIYLDNLCAASPTQLRPCQPGEAGVVISRYHDLKTQKMDWLAFPAFTFFYGVSSPDKIPGYITPHLENEIRESYRQSNLLSVLPDVTDKHGNLHPPPYGDWEEGIGAAYDRNVIVYTIFTTPEQDARILEFINSDLNLRRYTLWRHNCADFASTVLNLVIPGLNHRNGPADFNITTPKNMERLLDAYGHSHPAVDLQVYSIPQIPGSVRRSRPTRGCAELLLKTKRYFFTLLLIQPEVAITDAVLYAARGRWKPGLDAMPMSPSDLSETFVAHTAPAAPPNPVSSPDPSETSETPVDTGELNSPKLAYLPPPAD